MTGKVKRLIAYALAAYMLVAFGAWMERSSRPNEAVASTSPGLIQNTPTEEFTPENLNKHVNRYRKSKGLEPLKLDKRLNQSASDKCNDFVERDYWSHSIEGEDIFQYHEKYFPDNQHRRYGENIAEGYYNPNDVVNGWQNSPLHNENLVHENFNLVGYGICDDPTKTTPYVVQHFKGPQ